MSRSIKYDLSIGNLAAVDIVSTNITVGGLCVTDITTGNINVIGNLYQNGDIYVPSGGIVSSQWSSTNGNLYYTNSAGNSFVGINTSTPTTTLDVIGSARFSTGLTVGSILANGLVSAANIKTTNISVANLLTPSLRATNATISNLNILAASTGSIISTNESITNATTINMNIVEATAGSLVVNNINSINSIISNAVSTNATLSNIQATSASITNIVGTSVIVSDIVASGITLGNIISTNVSSVNTSIGNVVTNDILSTDVNLTNATVSNISTINSATNYLSTDNLITQTASTDILANNTKATSGTVGNMLSNNVSTTDATIGNLLATDVVFTNITTGNFNASKIDLTNKTSTNGSISNLIVTNTKAINSTITNLQNTNSTISNIISTNVSNAGVTTSNILATELRSQNIINTNSSMNNLITVNSSIGNVVATNVNITNATTANIYTTNATVDKLVADNIINTDTNISNVIASVGITTSNVSITIVQNQNIVLANQAAIGANNIAVQYQIGSGTSGSHVFYTNSTTGQSNEAMGTERMRINGSGNIGIGTNTPNNKLHIVGDVLVDDIIYSDMQATNISVSSLITNSYNNTLGPVLTSVFNVGIGISNPVTNLHIGPSAEQMITLNNGTDYTGIGVSDSTTNYMGGVNTDHIFYKISALGDKGVETMRVDKDGKLTVNSISTSSVNLVNLTASSLSILQNVTVTNITASNIITPAGLSLSVNTVTTGNISASNDTRVKGNVSVNGSLTAVNITSVNLIQNNISTSTLAITGLSNLRDVTTTNISSSSHYIYNSATSGTTNYAMTALANINPGNRVGTIMGKTRDFMSGIYTWYEYIGNNNLSNYVHYDFNGFNNVFVMNARGRVGFATNNPSNTLHVAGSARVSSFVTTNNLITNNISTGTLISNGLSSLQNVTATNQTLATLTVTGITTTSILVTGLVSSANLSTTTATLPNVSTTNATVSNLIATGSSNLQNVTATNVSSSSLTTSGVSTLQNVTSTNVSTNTLVASGLSNLQNVTATNQTLSSFVVITGITTASILVTGLVSIANLSATVATLPNLVLTNKSVSGLTATGPSGLQNVTGTNVSASTLTVSGLSSLQNVNSTNVSTSTLVTSGLSNLQDVTATNETLATLRVTGITSVSLLATGLVSVANLSITNYTFPNINLTNTNVTVSSLIVPGSSGLQNVALTNVTMSNLLNTLITTTDSVSTNITMESMFINGGSSGTAGTLWSTRMLADITTGSRIGGYNGKNIDLRNAMWSWYEHLGDSNTSNYVHHDFSGAINVLVLNAQGRIGVGTTNPSNTLHVYGELNGDIAGTMLVSGLITTSNLMATSLSYNNNSQFIINSGAVTSQNIMLTNVSGGGVINFVDGHHAIWGGIGADGARNEMQFREYGAFDFANGGALQSQTTELFITGAGNVGINTNNPSNKLHVNGILRVNNSITTGSLFAQDITANGIVSLQSTRGILIGSSTNIDDRRFISALDSGMLSGQARWLSFGQAASLNNQAQLGFQYAGSGSASNQLFLGFFGNKVMTILANGSIGIGTETPTCLLDVNGVGSNQFNLTDTVSGARLRAVAFTDTKTYLQTPGDMVFTQVDDASFSRMTVATTGNIGINTYNPTSRMAVQYNSSVNSNENTPNGIQINSSNNNTTTALYMGADATNDAGYIQSSKVFANLALALNPRGGNVGIMTTNPTSTLHVNGSMAKTSGTFDIKHPLKENTRLVHSFVEAPRCDLIYRGSKQLVNGQAIVDINMECTHSANGGMSPGTFEALCGNPQVFVRSNTSFEELIGNVSGGELTIQSNDTASNTVIDWMVIAERIDPDIKKWDRTDQDGYLVTEYVI